MTDVTGLRDHPARRGPAELRLDELFPDRLAGRGPGGRGDPSDRGRRSGGVGQTEAVESGVGEREVVESGVVESGVVEREAVNPRHVPLDADEFDPGYSDEPDPFAGDHRPVDGADAQVSVRTERASRFGRLAALARVGRWRIDPERRGAVAVMAAILVAAVAVGWQAIAGRPQAEPVSDTTASASFVAGPKAAALSAATTRAPGTAASAGAGTTPAAAAKVIVDVVGRVHRPGLVTLPAGARVADAVRAAGGALPGTNLASINLARVCVDGEQIAVGVTGATAPAGTSPTGAAPGSGAPAGLVNLNTATAEQLDALPGVGPVMAQRIIAYRTDHGPFTAVSQLQQVSGIGDAKYADLRPLVTV